MIVDSADIEMMSVTDIVEAANEALYMKYRGMDKVCASKFGLDPRAGLLATDGDSIIVPLREAYGLDYYGGFEYVDKSAVAIIGDYKIYSCDDERVADAISAYETEEA